MLQNLGILQHCSQTWRRMIWRGSKDVSNPFVLGVLYNKIWSSPPWVLVVTELELSCRDHCSSFFKCGCTKWAGSVIFLDIKWPITPRETWWQWCVWDNENVAIECMLGFRVAKIFVWWSVCSVSGQDYSPCLLFPGVTSTADSQRTSCFDRAGLACLLTSQTPWMLRASPSQINHEEDIGPKSRAVDTARCSVFLIQLEFERSEERENHLQSWGFELSTFLADARVNEYV